jgi:hypothetical protein
MLVSFQLLCMSNLCCDIFLHPRGKGLQNILSCTLYLYNSSSRLIKEKWSLAICRLPLLLLQRLLPPVRFPSTDMSVRSVAGIGQLLIGIEDKATNDPRGFRQLATRPHPQISPLPATPEIKFS